MSEWPACGFIIPDGAEASAALVETRDKTGWETVIFVVEDDGGVPPAVRVASQ